MEAKIYPIVPASGNPIAMYVTMAVPVILLLVMAALFSYIGSSMKNVTFELSSKGIQVKGDLYARLIPSSSMIKDKARIMDTLTETGYRPSMRTNGIAMPGYASGWYRLKNGEKVLTFVTNPKEVVYIPTKDGYALMISPQNPQGFLDDLKKMSN